MFCPRLRRDNNRTWGDGMNMAMGLLRKGREIGELLSLTRTESTRLRCGLLGMRRGGSTDLNCSPQDDGSSSESWFKKETSKTRVHVFESMGMWRGKCNRFGHVW